MNDFSPADLIQAALRAVPYCYAPYSHFRVAAALLTATGQIYCGVNIENVAFSPTICAERAAIASAISQGGRNFVAIAIVSQGAVAPCGVCRQVLGEFKSAPTDYSRRPTRPFS
jgi:cytidine deaminase